MIDVNNYILALEAKFISNGNTAIAEQQKLYMQDKFEFYGLKAPIRRDIQKCFLEKTQLPNKSQWSETIQLLWDKPQREFQMFGLDLSMKFKNKLEINDIELLQFMIVSKSWWDIVDLVASHLIGGYFKKFPKEQKFVIEKWMNSGNFWMQRACLLFQLKYKNDLNKELLENLISKLIGSNEFFIDKAIGWVLREYSKVNPKWVLDYANRTDLSTLSRREALRLIK